MNERPTTAFIPPGVQIKNTSRGSYHPDLMRKREGSGFVFRYKEWKERPPILLDRLALPPQCLLVRDALVHRSTTTYDAAGESIARIDPLGNRTSSLYDKAGRVLATIDPLGSRTTSIFDAAGEQVASINALGYRTSTTFDAAGRSIASIDPLGNRTSTTYDAAGQALATIDPLGNRTSTSYDAAGRTVATTNPRGYRTTSLYLATGWLQATIDPLLARTTNAYDAAGRQRRTLNALGFINTTLYDAAGRTLASIDPLANRTTSLYDAAGKTVATVNALGNRTTTTYDAAAQAIATIDPLARRTSTSYDAAGRQIARTDPAGHRTTTLYDIANRSIATINALGYRTSLGYDAAGRRTRLTDARGNRVTFQFDRLGQDLGSTDPLNRRVTFGYDPAGNKTRKLDPRAIQLTSVYDAARRLTAERYSTGRRSTYGYDAANNRTRMADSTGRTTSTFDAKNRALTTTNADGKRITYAYDALDRRITLADPDGGRFSYSYDGKNRQTQIINPQSKRASLQYDAIDRLTRQQQGDGGLATLSYDAANRLTVRSNATGAAVLVNRFSYSYDPAGNRSRVLEANGDRTTWSYDVTNQLTRELRSGLNGFSVSYSYDAAGNRSTQTDSGTRTTSTYDAANQLSWQQQGSTRTTFQYDASGNRTQQNAFGAISFYNWDETNRLSSAHPPAGPVTMSYNADGHRTQKQTSTQTRKFIYDLEKVLQETDGTNTTQKEYTSTTDLYGDLLSGYFGGTSNYYAPDGLGSTDALINDTHTATDRYVYRAFGLANHIQGTAANDFDWVGKQGYFHDPEINFYFVRARYYDYATAQWVSEDPLGYRQPDPNLFRYAGNNPINQTDPSGLQFGFGIGLLGLTLNIATWKVENLAQDFPDDPNLGPPPTDKLQLIYYHLSEVNATIPSLVRNEGRAVAGAVVDPKYKALIGDFNALATATGAPAEMRGWWDTAWEWVVNEASRVIHTVNDVAGAVGSWVIDQIKETIGRILKAVPSSSTTGWPGFGSISSLWDGLQSLVDLDDAKVRKLFNRGLEIGRDLAQALYDGVKDFLSNFGQNALDAVLNWATSDLTAEARDALFTANWCLFTQALNSPDKLLEYLGEFLLDFLGISWDRILNAVVGAALNFPPLAAVIRIFEDIWPVVEIAGTDGLAGVGKWAQDKVSQVGDLLAEIPIKLLETLTKQLVAKVVEWIAALNPAGGLAKALLSIYRFVKWVIDNWQRIEPLLTGFKTVAGLVLNADGSSDALAREVRGYVVMLLRGGLENLLGVLAAVTGLGDIKKSVSTFINSFAGVVPRKVGEWTTKALEVAWSYLKAFIKGIVSPADQLVAVTSKDGQKHLRVVAQGGGVKVLFGSGQTERELTESTAGVTDLKSKATELQAARMVAQSTSGTSGTSGTRAASMTRMTRMNPGRRTAQTAAEVGKKAKTILEAQRGAVCSLAMCFGAGERWRCGLSGSAAIEEWTVGGRAFTVEAREPVALRRSPVVEYAPVTARVVELLQEAEGERHEALLLRTGEWLEAEDVRLGGTVEMSLPEMGMVGPARVVAIHACPELEQGPGRLVTGRFRHTGATVYDLWVEGESKAIRVTGRHPFWSVDRGGWVAVAELEPGERLLGMHGKRPRVESLGLCAEQEPVYNIEVEGDHCYRVGRQGLLVHNASAVFETAGHQVMMGVGDEFAEPAQKDRIRRGTQGGVNYRKGKKNFAAVVILVDKTGEMRLPSGGGFYLSGATGDSEVRIVDGLKALFGGTGKPCFTIVRLFSERTPCPSCTTLLNNAPESTGLENYSQPNKYPVIWIVENGTSEAGLAMRYAEIGLPLE